MSNIYEILCELASNNSRNFKIDLLKQHSDNELLKRVCAMTLNPLLVFHIKKIPTTLHASNHEPTWTLEQALTALNDLSNRVVTGNAAIEHLRTTLQNVSLNDAEVIKRVILKDLRCGVSVATVAAVWPEFSKFKFPVMLATPFDQKLIDKLDYPVVVQQKEDGLRISTVVDSDEVMFFSRKGTIVDVPSDELKQAFVKLSQYFGFPVVFDGEMLVIGADGNFLRREAGNGIANKAIKGTMTSKEAANVRVVLWDVIPLLDHQAGIYSMPYETRLDVLKTSIISLQVSYPELANYISIVPTTIAESFDEIQQIFDDYIDRGSEGLIIKNRDSIWENTRSKNQIKMKAEEDIEAEVVDWMPGTGKNTGLMGALVCKSGDIEFNVGTGFTEQERKEFTADYIVGKIITVTYNQVITEKTSGRKSLFLPRFNCVRFDKDTI